MVIEKNPYTTINLSQTKVYAFLIKSLKYIYLKKKKKELASASDDCALYHQTMTSIGFWYKRELHSRSSASNECAF